MGFCPNNHPVGKLRKGVWGYDAGVSKQRGASLMTCAEIGFVVPKSLKALELYEVF